MIKCVFSNLLQKRLDLSGASEKRAASHHCPSEEREPGPLSHLLLTALVEDGPQCINCPESQSCTHTVAEQAPQLQRHLSWTLAEATQDANSICTPSPPPSAPLLRDACSIRQPLPCSSSSRGSPRLSSLRKELFPSSASKVSRLHFIG